MQKKNNKKKNNNMYLWEAEVHSFAVSKLLIIIVKVDFV